MGTAFERCGALVLRTRVGILKVSLSEVTCVAAYAICIGRNKGRLGRWEST